MEEKDEMARLYREEEYSLSDLAVAYDVCAPTIRYHLLRMGVQLRPRSTHTARARAKVTGPRNAGWKGGRLRDHGYIRILKPDHPQANVGGYVLEHRWIAEMMLKASDPTHPALLPTGGIDRHRWHVHHINGQKDDNRPSNLQVLKREFHSSWLHHHAEVARLRALLAEHGVPS